MSFALFHPRSAPLELTGASRVQIVVPSLYGRTTKLTFSCSSDKLPGHTQSNLAEAFEAFRSAISFRRLLVLHDRERNNHRSVKSWASRPQTRKAESRCLT